MISRADWDKLTPQAQWDMYCLLVSECGDSDEVEAPQLTSMYATLPKDARRFNLDLKLSKLLRDYYISFPPTTVIPPPLVEIVKDEATGLPTAIMVRPTQYDNTRLQE